MILNPVGRSLSWQIGLALGALAILAFMPPPSGRLLLVPVGGASQADILGIAIAADARLVGTGPLPESLVVEGTREALLSPLLEAGVILLAAPAAGCGVIAGRVA